jgi:hypothetical protein
MLIIVSFVCFSRHLLQSLGFKAALGDGGGAKELEIGVSWPSISSANALTMGALRVLAAGAAEVSPASTAAVKAAMRQLCTGFSVPALDSEGNKGNKKRSTDEVVNTFTGAAMKIRSLTNAIVKALEEASPDGEFGVLNLGVGAIDGTCASVFMPHQISLLRKQKHLTCSYMHLLPPQRTTF